MRQPAAGGLEKSGKSLKILLSTEALFTSNFGEAPKLAVVLTGSRLALVRQRELEDDGGFFLWADTSLIERERQKNLADPRPDKPPLEKSYRVPIRITGLVEGVKAVDLPSLSVDVEPR